MSEVVQDTQQEFWRPPSPLVSNDLLARDLLAKEIILRETVPAMAEACRRCGSEFLLGSGFCHSCGRRRPEAGGTMTKTDAAALGQLWDQTIGRLSSLAAEFSPGRIHFPSWLRYLHFHEIERRIGLSPASLIAFMIGVGCIVGALFVGLLTAKNFVEWQAIQFYRGEWLLAATASFVAGILLKKPTRRDRN